jgi:transposase-like protein
MKRVRYPAGFKAEAVKRVTERGHGVVDVAKRLDTQSSNRAEISRGTNTSTKQQLSGRQQQAPNRTQVGVTSTLCKQLSNYIV